MGLSLPNRVARRISAIAKEWSSGMVDQTMDYWIAGFVDQGDARITAWRVVWTHFPHHRLTPSLHSWMCYGRIVEGGRESVECGVAGGGKQQTPSSKLQRNFKLQDL